ncbi:MAG: hypothetical protein AAF478_13010 [Pseudomonadota bacterium]
MVRYRVWGLSAMIAASAVLAAVTVSTTPVRAQSFSCANAQIPSELAVCNNENLLIKDERLAALFADIVIRAVGTKKFEEISNRHSEWLKQRNSCKIDFVCLETKYDNRIRELQPVTDPNLSAFVSERF